MTEEHTCLEVCVDSFESAMAAIRGGADRLELCGCLIAGGLTPEVELLEQIRSCSDIPIRCLMRPRAGDFLYAASELSRMLRQIPRLRDAGADGFVIGCLTAEGELDLAAMERLVRAAEGTGLTLHRAFDVCRDWRTAARQAAELDIDTILTSGQAADCWSGRQCLLDLAAEELPLTVMPGAGINADAIRKLLALHPFTAFHMSGKAVVDNGMRFRREGVPMGLPGLDEFSIWQTDEKKVRQAALVLKGASHAD